MDRNTITAAGKLANSERLFVVDSRAAISLYNNDPEYSVNIDGTNSDTNPNNTVGSAGPIASIRLVDPNNDFQPLVAEKRSTDTRYDGIQSLVSFYSYTQLLNKGNDLGGAIPTSNAFDHFILTSYDIGFSEKTQIMTTFGDQEVVYYFGSNPVIVNLRGVLIDSLHNAWFTEFVTMYKTFFRGSQLSQNFEMIEIVLPAIKMAGSVISLTVQQTADSNTQVPFSMQFYAKSMEMIPIPSADGSLTYTMASGADNISFAGPTKPISGTQSVGGLTEPAYITASNTLTTSISNWFGQGYDPNSPVVSVLGSLTKTIASVNGSVNSLVSSFTNPLNAVLTGVTSIATEAVGIANLITQETTTLGNIVSQPAVNLKNALNSLHNAAGIIINLPQSVSQAFKSSVKNGQIGGKVAVLGSGLKYRNSKIAALSSGKPYTPEFSFNIII